MSGPHPPDPAQPCRYSLAPGSMLIPGLFCVGVPDREIGSVRRRNLADINPPARPGVYNPGDTTEKP